VHKMVHLVDLVKLTFSTDAVFDILDLYSSNSTISGSKGRSSSGQDHKVWAISEIVIPVDSPILMVDTNIVVLYSPHQNIVRIHRNLTLQAIVTAKIQV
jgi:hypothetical protein